MAFGYAGKRFLDDASDDHSTESAAACCDPFSRKRVKQELHQYTAGNDADLAKEMNELSFEEREKVFDDVHGVAAVHDETPGFVEQALRDFDTALLLPKVKSNRRALNRALFLWPGLKTDRAFKLRFLRAERFDSEKAAGRMAMYYEQKKLLFGEDKLVKKITLADLSEEDLSVFRRDFVVELPFKDRSGRPIIFVDNSKLDFSRMTVDGLLRCYWYLVLAMTCDDETAQRKGVTAIMYCPGNGLSLADVVSGRASLLAKRSGELIQCFPFRYACIHICYDDAGIDFLIHTLRAATGRNTRLRFRTHFGSELENEYRLMTFGISMEGLMQQAQMGATGVSRQYLERRREIDDHIIMADEAALENSKPGMIVSHPNPMDVLVGRGISYTSFSGNQRWNRLILAHLEKYSESSNNFEKTCITVEIVNQVRGYKGRFLTRTDEGWEILEDARARGKVAMCFRNTRRAQLMSAAAASGGNDHHANVPSTQPSATDTQNPNYMLILPKADERL